MYGDKYNYKGDTIVYSGYKLNGKCAFFFDGEETNGATIYLSSEQIKTLERVN